jgi:ferritin-like metal-binding protein YciE
MTRAQITHLEQVFEMLEEKPRAKNVKPLKAYSKKP